jgi:hypothetical protein
MQPTKVAILQTKDTVPVEFLSLGRNIAHYPELKGFIRYYQVVMIIFAGQQMTIYLNTVKNNRQLYL